MEKIIDGNIKPVSHHGLFYRILDWLFPRYESMSGNGACPVYLERWTLDAGSRCGIYLHHFIADDWALDPHDHPRRFVSIGLCGWYWEDVFTRWYDRVTGETGFDKTLERYVAPWIRTFPADHLHRIRASECGNCWTFIIVLPKSRPWGFVQNGVWIPVKEYVFGGKSRKAC